jgi:putative DNA primase/helicase
MSSFEHIHDFKQAMSASAIPPPEIIVTDGKIHRFGHKKNSWYVFHEGDISGAAFGDWKLNVNETWCSKQATQFTQAEREQWLKQKAEINAKVEAEKLAKQQEAAKKASRLWKSARSDVDLKHGYLVAKGNIYPYGVQQLGQALLVPVYDEDKQLTGLQFIYADGTKKFLTGTKKKGSFHFLIPKDFNKDDVQIVCIVEGWANGVTVLMAMDCLVFIAFDCGNLLAVAELAKRKYPHALIVMCADIEPHKTGIKAASEAANAVNGVAAIPTGQTDEKGKLDFNDVFRTHGLEAVKTMIDAAIDSKKAVPDATSTASTNDDLANESIDDGFIGGETKAVKPMLRVVTVGQLVVMKLPPRENLLAPWLPIQGLAMVYAPRGIGKTFFALNVAYAVASGGEFLCWQAPQAQTVLYIDGEMPVNSMQERLGSIIAMHQAEANEDALRIMTPDLQQDIFMPDLATIEGQQAIEPFLEGVKLIVIDNISTLCRSGRENESEGWITVQEWALRQRSAGRSVLFVHHAGKGGNQRGTSKREDVLDTVINLKRPIDYNPSEGASFEVHFEKTRGFSGEDAEPLSCRLGTDEHHAPAWLYSRLEDSTFDKVVTLINEGLSQAEIASELDINKSNISRHVKKARLQGLIQEPKTKSKPVNSANYSRMKDGE